jgi:hypothetical protein
MDVIPVKLSNRVDRLVRDRLYDLVGDGGLDAFAASYADEVLRWKSEKNQRMRRFKWCLATLHTREELEGMVRQRLSAFELGVDAGEATAFSGAAGSVEHTTAGLCDMILFGELNLSWGEDMDVGHFGTLAEATAYANELNEQGIDNTGPYGSNGDYYVVSDPHPED